MTKDEIIQIAKEAGFSAANYPSMFSDSEWEALGKMLDFAATHERQEFAKHAVEIARMAIKQEREECAKVCDEYAKNSSNPMNFAENCATAIRARGNT